MYTASFLLSMQAMFGVNVFGTITLTRLLTPFMLRRGKGHFVVVRDDSLMISNIGYGIWINVLF